jgi:hypothetical protein
MGSANSFNSHRTGGVVLATCISILLSTGITWGEERQGREKESKSKPHFASERPKLRPLFGKPHEEGVENNKFNDGGEVTVSPVTLKSPKGTTDARGFDPDPGGVTPPIFNPDPGVANPPDAMQPAPTGPSALMGGVAPEDQPLAGRQKLPRVNVRGQVPVRRTWEYPEYYEDVTLLGHIKGGGYIRDGQRDKPYNNSVAIPNRWEITVPHWQRYMDPSTEAPYMYDTPRWWHPYEQSRLKGDVPIIGQDIFLNITAKNFSLFEMRKLPTPSGVSAAVPNSSEFFGRSQQLFFSNDTSLAIDLFEGETAFKPVHWLIRMLGVYNTNWIRVRENNAVDPDPRGTAFNDHRGAKDGSRIGSIGPDGDSYNPKNGIPDPFGTIINPADVFNYLRDDLNPQGDANYLQEVDARNNIKGKARNGNGSRDLSGTRYTTRRRDFFALQEAFAELHISDLSDNYDFISSRWGIQPFVSDFRGFIYADTNLGARVFGNWDNNRIQYNLAYFNQREKDTYSDLNTFESRHQQILIANVFRQDLVWKGYTGQLSFLANFDDGGTHYDKNGFLTRPSILGTIPEGTNVNGADGALGDDQMRAFYLGWTGDGHIGRWNITHALYWAFGEDKFNPFTGRRVDINAGMGALELSYDRDWYRIKASGFYATGDAEPSDDTATGFDSIQDNPFFIGGPFSWYVHQGFNLAGTGVNLKQRDSLVVDFRPSKSEGQSNFVNPGVAIVGLGADINVTPKLKAFVNANYIWFAQTKPIELALQTNKAHNDMGLDLSLGFKYRPFLTEQVILSAGLGVFLPGEGYKDIYRRNTDSVQGYGPQTDDAHVDHFLYNAFFTLTLVY